MFMHMAVFVAMLVAVFVRVGFSAVEVLMGVQVFMPVLMLMFVFVGPFHGCASFGLDVKLRELS
jgi:hypothetical protein